MSLRVISGIAKGRKLKSVPGDTTRPITDRVKEALFNILAGDIQGAAWWDLFAGTGAVGIEALSREAAFAFFTDSHRAPIETIKWNLDHCKLSESAKIRQADAFAMLASPADRVFDYVYIAPPQYKGMWSKALTLLDSNPAWLVEDAWIIAQIHPREYEALVLEHLEEFDQRKYGTTLLVFYERRAG